MIKPLTKEENKDLLKRAENLWKSLQKNDLGGYSGINRPFWIVSVFREIIEEFGNRDTGYTWSQDDLKKAREAGVVDSTPSSLSASQINIIHFLCGEQPYKGFWFGETPAGENKFWWRKHLRDEFFNVPADSTPSSEVEYWKDKCYTAESDAEIHAQCHDKLFDEKKALEAEVRGLIEALEKLLRFGHTRENCDRAEKLLNQPHTGGK